ncbi:hypothetical protein HYQ46_007237 [Verticillium longisporum]|nr:hypothetical protein HYQ46_007237 [Verticillium longisporum]
MLPIVAHIVLILRFVVCYLDLLVFGAVVVFRLVRRSSGLQYSRFQFLGNAPVAGILIGIVGKTSAILGRYENPRFETWYRSFSARDWALRRIQLREVGIGNIRIRKVRYGLVLMVGTRTEGMRGWRW